MSKSDISGSSDYRGSWPRTTRRLSEWHAAAPTVEVVEPALPIVDPHHHLFGTLDDDLHYRLDDLRQDLSSGHQVIGTVYVEAYESGWRATGPEWLRPIGEIEQIASLTPSPLHMPYGACQVAAGIVSHVDLTLGDALADVLEHEMTAAQGRLRGIRHRTATVDGTVGRFIAKPPKPHLMREPEYLRGVGQLRRYGLCLDAWLYHTQIDEFIALADACPDTTMVLNHVGGVIGVADFKPCRSEVIAYWQDRMRALAQRPNVCVKLGGMGMPVFGFGFEHSQQPPSAYALVAAWTPMIDFCVDAFGTERCMFESNFPPDKQSCSYAELWNAFKLATATLTRMERADLFYRTACRIYRLPELTALGDSLMFPNSHDSASYSV